MKAVGIKQLKARLSEYLRMVKSGETILVTERNDVVAEMRPARRSIPRAEALEDILDALVEAGQITRAAFSKKGWTMRCKGLGAPAGLRRPSWTRSGPTARDRAPALSRHVRVVAAVARGRDFSRHRSSY